MSRPTSKTRIALSLVETIVVTGLISTVFLLVVGLIPSFKLANRRAGMELQASSIAQSTLEVSRATKFDDLVDSTSNIKLDGVDYTQVVTVTPSPSGLTKTVVVRLSWTWKEKTFELTRESIVCRIPRA